MTLDRQVERARRHMDEHRAKHGDPMLDGRKDRPLVYAWTTDEEVPPVSFSTFTDEGVPVYTYPETLPWWRRFIAWWRG